MNESFASNPPATTSLTSNRRVKQGILEAAYGAGAADPPERPFPLRRLYQRRVLPILGLFVVSLVVLTAFAVRQAVHEIHLEFAARQVAEITDEIRQKAPAEWSTLLAAKTNAEDRNKIAALLTEATTEHGLPQFINSGV